MADGDGKSLWEKTKESNVEIYNPKLTLDIVKEVYGKLFDEMANRPKRKVVMYTNEAGMFLFNLAVVFGTYYTDGVRYWIDVIKDRKGSIRFGYISLFEKGGLYKMKVYPEYSGRKNRFEFYYGTELLGVSDTVEAVKELDYKGPQTPYHIPRRKERERDGYMIEKDITDLGWVKQRQKSPFGEDVYLIDKGDNVQWIEHMANSWTMSIATYKENGHVRPSIRLEHYSGGGFTGLYETNRMTFSIERRSELEALMKMLRI